MKILAIVFFSYLTLSIIGFMYCLIFKAKVFNAEEKPIYYTPIIIGAFISLLYVLYFGFKELLVLIPESWGDYNNDGHWSSVKDTIAALLSLSSTFYFFYLIVELDRKEEVIQKLKNQHAKKS